MTSEIRDQDALRTIANYNDTELFEVSLGEIDSNGYRYLVYKID